MRLQLIGMAASFAAGFIASVVWMICFESREKRDLRRMIERAHGVATYEDLSIAWRLQQILDQMNEEQEDYPQCDRFEKRK